MRSKIAFAVTAIVALPTFPLWILPLGAWVLLDGVMATQMLTRASSTKLASIVKPSLTYDLNGRKFSLSWEADREGVRVFSRAARFRTSLATLLIGSVLLFLATTSLPFFEKPQLLQLVGLSTLSALLFVLQRGFATARWVNKVNALAGEGAAASIDLGRLHTRLQEFESRTGKPPAFRATLERFLHEEWELDPTRTYQRPAETLERVVRRCINSLEVAMQTAGALKDSPKPTWWNILGLHPDATYDEARRAYRKRLKQMHPDSAQGSTQKALAAEKLQEVVEAWAMAQKELGG